MRSSCIIVRTLTDDLLPDLNGGTGIFKSGLDADVYFPSTA